MIAWFKFKDRSSLELGVYVTEYPPATIPEERAEFKPIPGRSGEVTFLEGDAVYEDIVLSIDCYARNLTQLDEIAAWLRGCGDLVLGRDPDHRYWARAVNQIELNKILRGRSARTFSACFRCAPFRYEVAPEPITPLGPLSLDNPSSITAMPFIVIHGTGRVQLTVGDTTVTLTDMAGAVTIDCDAKEAYKGNPDQQTAITLEDEDWPELGPGTTQISWAGDVRRVEITPNWRWL